ncbi:MAG: DASS family sodium-coupled anion symporter [Pelotomaculum sp.]|uniref:Sodium-dependent dicarboxylate transporter SdcS n=1 Tax=Pelotomaculum thermopropionicum (strain DSM 13744 / JCM 10971 / SI) TaxID=370438 RepID=A5D226_PELTS|nr:DASS family sodium-coupled anion symporter [Pelotomaculum sp.]BAF59723.1 di- and tricarboxylate transporters [Pelotomaculum thermopropionicum SI]
MQNTYAEKKIETISVTTKRIVWVIALLLIYFVLANLPAPAGLKPEGQKAIALMVVVVIAWITEVIPIAIASLFFVFMQHVTGVSPQGTAVANFATPTLLFVVASFFMANALNMSGLSQRISMKLTILSGGNPKKALFYIMVATALISSVISDVPACAAFFPIGMALLEKNNCRLGSSNLGRAMMIGIPFSSLIGGVATPAGSSLNVLSLSLLKSTSNIEISFTQWSAIGIPVVIVTIPIVWKILTMIFPPEIERLAGIEDIHKEYAALGPVSAKEIKFLVIFAMMLITWFTEPYHKIPLPVSATIGAAFFFLPGIDLLTWENTKQRIGWDTILLIGAANSLGTSLWQSGAATWLAESALRGIQGASPLMVILFVVVFTILIHLLVPVNAAIVSIMVPTLASLAVGIGISPAFLIIPMGFTVSAAFLLPLDPVPLITYASGHYKMTDYFKTGWPTCIFWTVIVTAAMLLLARPMGLF